MPIKNKLKVFFLSAEVAPLAKTGGLGDVAGALPKALSRLGADIRICLPFYGLIDRKKYAPKKIADILVPIDYKMARASVWETKLPDSNVPVYFIKHKLFDAKAIYVHGRQGNGIKYTRRLDDLKRFSFFTAASLVVAKTIKFRPDIIHANDWHAALVSDFLKTFNPKDDFFRDTKTIYTIHNLANQGIAAPEVVMYSRLNPDLPVIKADLKNGDLNFMVQGILTSDIITTVSPTYAKEILCHYNGAGLDNLLALRKKDIRGILNGIDTDEFNPGADSYLKYHYSSNALKNRIKIKLALQKKLGWLPDKKICLIGLVSRLVWQKGLDLFTDQLIADIKQTGLNFQLVFLGSGQKKYEEHLTKLAEKFPDRIKTVIGFEEKLAREIYAGSDLFLVPSRFEPCGLTQMIAMRYGAVPVVRATGGLKDTVDSQVGFSFKDYSSQALAQVLIKALKMYYNNPAGWKKIQLAGMKRDFSWKKSAKEYLDLYKRMIAPRIR